MKKRERQYERLETTSESKIYKLGSMINDGFHHDPRRIAFTASRYKFVSKMLSGVDDVLEVGCGDGFMSRIVLQEVKHLDLTDFDESFVIEAQTLCSNEKRVEVFHHDPVREPFSKAYNAIYALDVLEHVPPNYEAIFMENLALSLQKDGICIIGMPSIESQLYASEISKAGHVNCKNGETLRAFMNLWFESTFIFSMNDEVVHTGFFPMSQYLIAVSTHPRLKNR